jgi:RNA polymerase sigma factor (sigma-70 family)
VRDGHDAGFTELYMRHRAVARRIAATYRYPGDADDLVNEAFEKVYAALRRGSGPTGSFRAYLFVTMRHLAAERWERRGEELLDEVPEPIAAARKAPPMEAEERDIIVEAFESLPDRSQAVLWYTAVEGRHPRDLSKNLGMTPNAVSALAYRAREQLRQAYLQAHLRTARPQCEPHRSGLGAFVRDGQSQRDRARTQQHVEQCPSCRGLVDELSEVNRMLVRAVAPLFLVGSLRRMVSAGAVTTAASHAATTGGGTLKRLPTALGWAKGAVGTAGGVVAAAALLGGLAVTGSLLARDDPDDVTLSPAATGTSAGLPGGSSTASPAPSSTPPGATATAVQPEPCAPSASEAGSGQGSTPTTAPAEPRSTTGLSVEVPVLPEALGSAVTDPQAALPVLLEDPVCTIDEATDSGQLTLALAQTGQSSTTASSAPLVDLSAAGIELKVALSDGVLAVDAELPVGCEIADDGHTVRCTVDEALLASSPTLGLELLGASGPLATISLERDGETIDVRAVDLLGDVTGALSSVVPSVTGPATSVDPSATSSARSLDPGVTTPGTSLDPPITDPAAPLP